MKQNKIVGLVIIFFVYFVAILASVFLYDIISTNLSLKGLDLMLISLLLVDLLATTIVFIFSLIFKNASVYDPYWSVMPIFLIIFASYKLNLLSDPLVIVLILIFLLWGIRLTINWMMNFKSLSVQDWRYDHLKTKHPKAWIFINYFGIHLMPTLVVFFAMIPAFYYLGLVKLYSTTLSTWLGAIVCVVAVIIEAIADFSLYKFRKNPQNKGKIIKSGLWKVSRHPNYFGEIMFWLGICIMGVSFAKPQIDWVLIFSPLVMHLLFVVVSIPMMEKRQLATKKGYEEYKKSTNMLVPFFGPKND